MRLQQPAASGGEAQALQGGPITLEVFQRVVEPHFVSLEKAIQFLASREAQKLAQLRFGEPTGLVFLQTERFQGATGEVSARRGETLGDIVGDVNGELHGLEFSMMLEDIISG